MKGLFGITELPLSYTSRVPGFCVRLGWHNGKPAVHAEFGIETWGGRDEALQAAISYRDEQIKELKVKGEWPVKRVLKGLPKNNNSGVLGVSRSHQWGRGKKLDCYRWSTTFICPVKKKPVTIGFAENKWGADDAFQMACACREAKENIFKGLR